ncbi:emp24/gp25L/p24 family/GOLD-domain-containing protein [Radiomyces spectabilis]|uniref:emp24/gp25L/p24 family/GOLD-domain-containing protein n=1 Tax=Radiomyces spectabilis TaxID=64574 RepID=UPI0022211E01|nr:emp24/gp25L/p24 family/GOLD-domain-containing protein [Radiomyces spectabilis]KAI8388879.1 emp24/gp25L/p24 family/GOLD-domain-containing protein [Radiomyces spectabilis]
MIRQLFAIVLIYASILVAVSAVKFELPAVPSSRVEESKRCISQYVPRDTTVLLTGKIGQGYNQVAGFEIKDNNDQPNVYGRHSKYTGEFRNAFDTRSDGVVSICFTNQLQEGFNEAPQYTRTIELEFNVGAEALDLKQIASSEKLGPLEIELRRLESIVKSIVGQMDYLKRREERMRDTNESTNERVKWFSLLSLFTLISLGVWQILYLRSFFRRKRLID